VGGRGKLVVDGHAMKTGEPSKSALADPALGYRYKAAGTGWAAAHLVGEAEPDHVSGEAPAVALVCHHRYQALAPIRSGRQ